jgi:chitodextrinase
MCIPGTVRIETVIGLALGVVATAAQARDRIPPTTPTNLVIAASGPTSVTLAWTSSTDNSSNFWYCVQSSGQGCFRVDPPTTSFTHPMLWPGSTYAFSVVAVDAGGNRSGSSNTVTYTTPPDLTPPSPPPVLTATAVYPMRISLSWTASKDNATQVYYTLLKDGSPQVWSVIGSSSVTVLDLSPSTTYEFMVEARDAFGNVTRSNALSVTTTAASDSVPPTAPTNLRLSFESAAPEIWLDWDQSTDNSDPQSQIGYQVYLNGQLDHVTYGTGDTITYCPGTGATTIEVNAVDTSGNVSAPSNQIFFDC